LQIPLNHKARLLHLRQVPASFITPAPKRHMWGKCHIAATLQPTPRHSQAPYAHAKPVREWKLLFAVDPAPPESEKKKKPAKDEAPAPPSEPPKRVRHGRGKYTEGDYCYEGDFQEDMITGQGRFTYASGACYDGQWEAGMYHGYGKYSWPDGRSYEGQWQHNRMHGMGTYTDANSHKWSGQFFNGAGPGLTYVL
jgi:hypothetical protein